jgi:hypothetical protein
MDHGRVQEIGSQEEYARALLVATAARRLAVVDFSAKWYNPPLYALVSLLALLVRAFVQGLRPPLPLLPSPSKVWAV